ncbi:sugar phosphate nucleotidyltransferase [Dehalogenimonas sp. THU2]|uniref:sugar phosphate nucleotidyltransferase n=1 Tax=Dehalogenimonas sp. THU2 TaxID=3151121 RepID=UPI0032186D99
MEQAIILAAGEGQRLRPFTNTRPKVMISIAGKPILHHVIESLAAFNIRDIVIVTGYRKEQIYDSLGSGKSFKVNIRYIEQQPQLGTAHALHLAKSVARDDFFVLPGDNLITRETIRDFVSTPPWTVLLKSVPVSSTTQYGVAVVNDEDEVQAILEKPRQPCDGLISTGIYHLRREIFDHIGTDTGIPAVINRMTNSGINFKAVKTHGPWLDAVYPWDLLHLNDLTLKNLQPMLSGTVEAGVSILHTVSSGQDTRLCSGCYIDGPVLIGKGCDISPNTVITGACTIGDNVSIGPFCHIQNSVIGNDVTIGSGSILQNSVIDDGNHIAPHFSAISETAGIVIDREFHEVPAGVMMGMNCQIGGQVTALAGAIIGNGCQVKTGKTVSGWIKDGSQVV